MVFADEPGLLPGVFVFVCVYVKGAPSRRVPCGAPCELWSGGVLLSHTLPSAVPLPCWVLASGFGMGPGVSPRP